MTDIALKVDGAAWRGWQSIGVRRGLDQVAGIFELSVTERWPGVDERRQIQPGLACTLEMAGQTIITGYVDDANIDYDAETHTVAVVGRDQTGDLVDCSATYGQGQVRGQTLKGLAERLCEPFGMEVRVETDVGRQIANLQVEPGQDVFSILEEAARLRGVLLMSDGAGALVITAPDDGDAVATLELGNNILRASARFSDRDRFSEYLFRGQFPPRDWATGEQGARPSGKVEDTGIDRYRPLVIQAEEVADMATLRRRAEWERAARWGRSRSVTYTVPGWDHSDGLWTPNTRVRVVDAFLGLDETLLVVTVVNLLGPDGELTELELAPREAFIPEPATERRLTTQTDAWA